MKLSTGALLGFYRDDYCQKIQMGLTKAAEQALGAVRAKKVGSPTKNIKKTSKLKKRASRRKL